MSNLMKREEALRWLNDRKAKYLELIRRYPCQSQLMLTTQVIDMAIEALSNELVRCKDCFWFDQNIYRNCFRNRSEDEYAEWGVCTKLSHNMKVNDYCSCGEREAPYECGAKMKGGAE